MKEYWIVFPSEKAIEVIALDDEGKYTVHDFASMEEYQSKNNISSKLLESLAIDLKDLFET